MARTYTSEEKEKLLISIREYVLGKIKNNESFSGRDVAKYFSIGNSTASKYLNELAKANNSIKQVLEKNKPKTVEDEEVRSRINKAVILLLEKDYTVLDIANELGISPNIIYEDFQTRLIKMGYDASLLKDISKKLQNNRFSNLKNQGIRNPR